jgi:hypothetical protein
VADVVRHVEGEKDRAAALAKVLARDGEIHAPVERLLLRPEEVQALALGLVRLFGGPMRERLG